MLNLLLVVLSNSDLFGQVLRQHPLLELDTPNFFLTFAERTSRARIVDSEKKLIFGMDIAIGSRSGPLLSGQMRRSERREPVKTRWVSLPTNILYNPEGIPTSSEYWIFE